MANRKSSGKRQGKSLSQSRGADDNRRVVQNHTIDSQLKVALSLHQAGKLGEAESTYARVLVLDPAHIQANYYLGILYYQTKRFDQAIASYQKALQAKPDFVDAWSNLGVVLKAVGRKEDAIDSFKKALAIAPDLAPLHNNIGNTYRELGRVEDAIRSYQRAIELNPAVAEYHNNLGNGLNDLGKLTEAVSSFRASIRLKPDMPGVYMNLGSLLHRIGALADAESLLQKALTIKPDIFEIHSKLGDVLSDMGQMEAAIACYQQALELKPDCVEALNGKGLALRDMGQMDKAIEAFTKAISIRPDYVKAHVNLSQMRIHKEFDSEIEAMEQLYERQDLSNEQRVHLAFAIARAYENLGDYARSFELLVEGKKLQQVASTFDIRKTERLFTAIQTTYCADYFERHADVGFEDDSPIFILGMPRSGTSLVEQILASHPQVFGSGELKLIGELGQQLESATGRKFPDFDGLSNTQIFRDLGESYIRSIRQSSEDARYITDKMPANFLHIGLIATILPKARIVHCLRDPMDTCFSIFKIQFGEAHTYANSLEDLGAYYLNYKRLMAHWHRVLPGRLFTVEYEALVQDSENQIRKLLAYCDLPFDEACLSFHKTDRVVKTASAVQVRQPVYKHAMKFWKHYEQQLQPLSAILAEGS